jgi:hypothetical protein
MRWSTRLGPRGFVAYVAISTILGFAVRTWLVPIFKTAGERQRRALNDLRQQFGREPTSEELASYLGFDSLR